MFIFIGARPRTEMVAGLLELDEQGFVLTGPDLPSAAAGLAAGRSIATRSCSRPACPGVFAAGDVRAGSNQRVAAAVGEGSGAVGLVHAYLETV